MTIGVTGVTDHATTGDRLDARLRAVALLEAHLRGDRDAWDALWPTSGADAGRTLLAALELIAGQLTRTEDPVAVLASWRCQLIAGERNET